MSGYWVDGDGGCPIGGPFDLWRKNYFVKYGQPPEDTRLMYPALSQDTVDEVAKASTADDAILDDILQRFKDRGPVEQLTMAYSYFQEWRKHAPFMPDSWQDVPLRPVGTSPEPLEEFLDDWRKNVLGEE